MYTCKYCLEILFRGGCNNLKLRDERLWLYDCLTHFITISYICTCSYAKTRWEWRNVICQVYLFFHTKAIVLCTSSSRTVIIIIIMILREHYTSIKNNDCMGVISLPPLTATIVIFILICDHPWINQPFTANINFTI